MRSWLKLSGSVDRLLRVMAALVQLRGLFAVAAIFAAARDRAGFFRLRAAVSEEDRVILRRAIPVCYAACL
jgi:hypothetical protein